MTPHSASYDSKPWLPAYNGHIAPVLPAARFRNLAQMVDASCKRYAERKAGEMQQQVLLIPVLYSLFIVLSSSAVTVWYRSNATREALARDAAKIVTA